MVSLVVGTVLSFLVGSIPTAYLVGRFVCGMDIRKHGSGNVGATNVFRVVGKKWGIGVLAFDITKGFLAVSFFPTLITTGQVSYLMLQIIFGFAAIAGHTWTPWLGFRGGKGVATSASVFLALTLKAAVGSILVWTVIFYWKRYVSFASLLTALSFPLWVYFFYAKTESFALLFPISLFVPIFIFYTHRENIRRIIRGEEKRLL